MKDQIRGFLKRKILQLLNSCCCNPISIWFKCFPKLRSLLRTRYCIISRPWVEYKGTVPQNELQSKQKDLELEANALISLGERVSCYVRKLLFMWHQALKIFTLRYRFLFIYYHMMKLLRFAEGVFLIIFLRSVYKRYILTANNFMCYLHLSISFSMTNSHNAIPVTSLSYKVPSCVGKTFLFFWIKQ